MVDGTLLNRYRRGRKRSSLEVEKMKQNRLKRRRNGERRRFNDLQNGLCNLSTSTEQTL
jgi:hypothetical protein